MVRVALEHPLLARVAAGLRAEGIRFAAIGVAALARHGVTREEPDFDLLTNDGRLFDAAARIAGDAMRLEVDRTAANGSFAGSVRFDAQGVRSVAVVLGHGGWQEDAVRRALPAELGELSLPVVSVCDLILLKLHAGGQEDARDIAQLLEATDRETMIEQVDGRLNLLPSECARLWRRVLKGG